MVAPPLRLLDRINSAGDINDPGTPRPLLTLEEFFEGNSDHGSIGYNFYPDQPTPEEFYELFRTIRSRPSVADVRVEVAQHDDRESWPTTDTIWVVTSSTEAELRAWLGDRFAPDEVLTDFAKREAEPLPIPPGMVAFGVWWD